MYAITWKNKLVQRVGVLAFLMACGLSCAYSQSGQVNHTRLSARADNVFQDLDLATDTLAVRFSDWGKSSLVPKWHPTTFMGKVWKPFWLAYKILVSSQLQRHCFYMPSCSAFPFVAWRQHGVIAFFLIVDRYFRCNPLAVQDALRWNPWLGERLRW